MLSTRSIKPLINIYGETLTMLRGLVLFIFLCLAGVANAQVPETSTSTNTVETPSSAAAEILRAGDSALTETLVRDLVAKLSDEEVRLLLLERLDQVTKAELEKAAEQSAIQNSQIMMERMRGRLIGLFFEAPRNLPHELSAAVDTLIDGRPANVIWLILLGFAFMMVVGAVSEWLFLWATRDMRNKILAAAPTRPIGKIFFPFCRLIINLSGLFVFLVAAIITFFVLHHGHELTQSAIMTYVGVVALARAIGMVFLFVLAPNAANLRLVSFSDADAQLVYRRALLATWVGCFGFSTASLLLILGVDEVAAFFFRFCFGVFIVVTTVYTLIRSRKSFSRDIKGPGSDISPIHNAIADAWPYVTSFFAISLAPLVVIMSLSGVQINRSAGILTLIALIVLPHLDSAIERAARFRMEEKDRSKEFQGVIFRALRILVIVSAVFILAKLWGIDVSKVARDNVGGWLAGALIDIGATVLIAYVLWQMVRIWVDRKMEEEKGEEGGEVETGSEGGQGGSRLGTLLPLIRSTLQITIIVIATLVVLSGVGVDIGPLLAGAGVVGLAVGFGAQTLVKDVVSGAFFLLDDAFRVGEYIDVGNVKGTVEKISVRSLRLRHHRGLLHTIPFGEIQFLTNFSRDWVIMKMEFRLTYDTDVNKVKKLFKVIGQEMLEHEELGDSFMEPFKSQGVKRMEDSAMIVGAKFMAKPGQQFMIRKELFNRVQKAFAANDVHFAHKRVAVDLPEGFDANSPQGQAISNAAAAAVAAEEQEPPPGGQPKPA
jgi:small-conductance mechanosensitive channel